MKLKFKQTETSPESSFSFRQETIPCIAHDWHFHPELELIYFLKSTGTRYVGNSIGSFGPGELYLIGSNMPHLFRNEKEYYEDDNKSEAVDFIVVKFQQEFLGSEFMNLVEAQRLTTLIKNAKKGLKFPKAIAYLVHNYMVGLVGSQGLSSIIGLLKILDILSVSEHVESLCTEEITTAFKKDESYRMVNIINYLTNNFDKKIELSDISAIANMTTNSFCRYFKKQTKKSFSQYLNEIRIRNACRLLIEGEHQISDICYLSGFNTITNFNRQFKLLKECTPSEYMKKYDIELDYSSDQELPTTPV